MDEKEYTAELLLSWKTKGEDRARRALVNPSSLNAGPNFAETIALVYVQRDSLPYDPPAGLHIPAGHVPYQKILPVPVSVPYPIRDPYIYVNYGPAGTIPPGMCLITTACLNQGTGVDENVKIDVTFNSDAIRRHDLLGQNRIACIDGGRNGSWSASFLIPDLLPNECRHAIVGARDEPFDVKVYSQNSGRGVDIFRFDIVGDGWDTQPFEDSPWASAR
ncbi:hypothetical protein [Alienimonas californiensis]|uniref:hypothetical protein n=1 Tax=Alienimonas californiensis TaxID=2527989 RepID=UPI0011A6BC76|nr:hypothetical protein [Alienimonas californiensis]